MTKYVAYSYRDPKKEPVAFLEVEGNLVKSATRPKGDGIPTVLGKVPPFLRARATLNTVRRYNSGVVIEKAAEKIEKTAYRLVSEQTGEDAGYILVDDTTQTIEGYAGESPPVGYVEGQSISDFAEANRGYKIEAIPEPVVEVGEDAPVDTASEAARLIGVGVAAGLQATGVISKADPEQQIVYGWAYITHDREGQVVVDKSGDFIDSVEEIEKSALDFMLHHRASDLDHTNTKGGDVVESMVFTPEKKAAMGIPEGVLPNGWWIGVKCNDEQWKGYKEGRRAFSIHGAGTRKAVD